MAAESGLNEILALYNFLGEVKLFYMKIKRLFYYSSKILLNNKKSVGNINDFQKHKIFTQLPDFLPIFSDQFSVKL